MKHLRPGSWSVGPRSYLGFALLVILGITSFCLTRSFAQTPTPTPVCPSCFTPTPTPTPSCTCPPNPTPSPTPSPNIPLNDLGGGTYHRGADSAHGGLYSGSNQIPTTHYNAGVAIAASIAPLSGSCTPTPTPRIGLLSIGMCNAQLEFGGSADAFLARANADGAKNDDVVIINGAEASKDAKHWADINDNCWAHAVSKVNQQGLCPEQVAVVWMEHATIDPMAAGGGTAGFQYESQALQGLITQAVKNLHVVFPNAKLAFVSTRTRAYVDQAAPSPTPAHNPEPYAYETGFAVKYTIKSQIDGTDLCYYDPTGTDNQSCTATTAVAPYLAWGPYYWEDGTTPRSDGKTWLCSDLQADHVHPTGCGVHKVSDQLLAFFETSPLTTPWYLKPKVSNMTVTANFTQCTGLAPHTVQFCATIANGHGGPYVYSWDFDDGDYDYNDPSPIKSFPVNATYNVHLTVVDQSNGDHAQTTVTLVSP